MLRLMMAFAFLLTLSFGSIAHADQVEDLIAQLKTDTNYKVRIAAGLKLTKLADPRSVGPLTDALKDPDKTVRGVSASGLGKIVDAGTPAKRRAIVLTNLEHAAEKDTNAFVRKQARKAYDKIKAREKKLPSAGN